ncbi:MAG: phosphotransferase [Patescibacteria group bacterium]
MDRKAHELSESTDGFELGEKIYESGDGNRNVIYAGTFGEKPAVLKVYRDHRINDEPRSLEQFHQDNRSSVISAPKLYASEVLDHHAGWLIMERLEGGSFLSSLLSEKDKERFADILAEYHGHCQWSPTRPLTLAERLPANEYHRYRIARWLRMAVEADAARQGAGEDPVLAPDEFVPRFTQGLALIDDVFRGAAMTWGHGHLKPKDVYVKGPKVYLTDFGHAKMHPPGYEPAFAVWSDVMMAEDWSETDYAAFRAQVARWAELFRSRAKAFGIDDFDSVWRASLAERCLGMLTADITANEKPSDAHRRARRDLVYRLLDEQLTA